MTARERLKVLIRAEPTLIKAELARRLNVSPQRIAQLVDAESLAVAKDPRGRPRKLQLQDAR